VSDILISGPATTGFDMTRVLNKHIWPYQAKVDRKDSYGEIEKWCRENLYHGGYFEPNWYRVSNTFCFKDEKEYLHFMLVWL
jgi:hypothetical protein